MGQLGAYFPSGIRGSYADRHLLPGSVLYMHCPFVEPQKMKYLVVASIEPQFLLLIINSKINEFIQKRPHLLSCQVHIPQDSHRFLKHNSHASCIEAHEAIDYSSARDEVVANPDAVLVGQLDDQRIIEVISACAESMTMRLRHQMCIDTALKRELERRRTV